MRLPPLPADRWDDQVRGALAGMIPRDRQHPAGAGNALATLVRHPDLTRAYLGLGVHLLFRSTLPPRVRELAILRVAHRRGCAYEWDHHVATAEAVGLTAADIAAVEGGPSTDEFDRVVLDATDELDATSNLSDATWAALGTRLDERQCMDLVFTVGGYCMVAMAFNTFGVEVEQTER
ncbi:carboxymuconolactone decarboxylase family protein [Nocardia sp. JW2]|uniref:carboxymuconolactone decarboxylase family protein n=1 Tax=Nocardia TaxID=1817 RepID=UPI001CDA0E4D|nr:carboxymuconolactone decarboxylase family protein [Nocardia rosealba]MCA2207804.1 carboxymuconolactone decarboxylase family protein [Nocardia rosealba]